jgi:hypothetical protein
VQKIVVRGIDERRKWLPAALAFPLETPRILSRNKSRFTIFGTRQELGKRWNGALESTLPVGTNEGAPESPRERPAK